MLRRAVPDVNKPRPVDVGHGTLIRVEGVWKWPTLRPYTGSMRTLDELPVGAKFQARLLIDDPDTGRKAGDVVWLTWAGTVGSRPTTRWGRAMPRQTRHEPLDPSQCVCGATFIDPADALAHAEAWLRSWDRVRFRYTGDDGEQIARPLDHHEMAFPIHEADGSMSVVCECGWRYAAPDLSRVGPPSREHIRAVVRARIGIAA